MCCQVAESSHFFFQQQEPFLKTCIELTFFFNLHCCHLTLSHRPVEASALDSLPDFPAHFQQGFLTFWASVPEYGYLSEKWLYNHRQVYLSRIIKEASFATDGNHYRRLQLIQMQRKNDNAVPSSNRSNSYT